MCDWRPTEIHSYIIFFSIGFVKRCTITRKTKNCKSHTYLTSMMSVVNQWDTGNNDSPIVDLVVLDLWGLNREDLL